jgi:mRNA-degrading endonuclease YafQ of YafQ-DinJ toxin-antitoxin module
MGADFITITLNGKHNKTYIKKVLEKRAEQDAQENCHQHGYSGDWQCVRSFDIVSLVFKNKDDALKYLEDKCQKWDNALVVSYLTNDPEKPTLRTIIGALVPC